MSDALKIAKAERFLICCQIWPTGTATGTGKTATLQVMAEAFSSIGVPEFAADIEGDLHVFAICQGSLGKPEGKREHDFTNLVHSRSRLLECHRNNGRNNFRKLRAISFAALATPFAANCRLEPQSWP